MNYFADCKTLDEAKKRYRDLAMKLHPDKGGRNEDFQELQNQFEKFRPEEEKYKTEFEEWKPTEFMNIIEQLLKIEEIEIEVCGSWIWISGNTKPHKEEIKAVNTGDSFKKPIYHGKKTMWYISPVNYRKLNGRELSMTEIRNLYGSHKVNKEDKEEENKTKLATA